MCPVRRNLVLGLALLGAVAVAGGCAAHRIVVPAGLPQPLLQPHPWTVGLYADAAFNNYVHHGQLEGHSDLEFALGQASAAMFRQMLTAKFQRVATLPAPRAEAGSGIQIVFQPAIEDFQFSTPAQTQTEFYEVWIKYRVHLLAPDGHEIADWQIPAYGRQRDRLTGGTEEALAAAAQQALRDAAAALALYLRDPGKFPIPIDDRGK